jgi:hypothetical protein
MIPDDVILSPFNNSRATYQDIGIIVDVDLISK